MRVIVAHPRATRSSTVRLGMYKLETIDANRFDYSTSPERHQL